MRNLGNLIHRPDEPDGVWMPLRFGGSLPTSFTGRASRPGSDATCVVQRGHPPPAGLASNGTRLRRLAVCSPAFRRCFCGVSG